MTRYANELEPPYTLGDEIRHMARRAAMHAEWAISTAQLTRDAVRDTECRSELVAMFARRTVQYARCAQAFAAVAVLLGGRDEIYACV